MQYRFHHGARSAVAGLVLTACADVTTPTVRSTPSQPTVSLSSANARHVVVFDGDDAPADFDARVTSRGGRIDQILSGAGLAIVTGLTDAAAADLATTNGIHAVPASGNFGPDPSGDGEIGDEASNAGDAPQTASADPFAECRASTSAPARAALFRRQWNLCAIGAHAAWDAGSLGSPRVKVFLLDTGIDYEHPDLQGLVDPELSTSFVPETSPEYGRFRGKHPYMDFHSHGTGVASLISSNASSLAGVTQRTTLVSVKVLDRSRRGSIDVFLRGIYYAANNGADVIHFSFAFEGFDKRDSTGQVASFNKATAYAHRKGAVVVVAAGNASVDLDHNGDNWRVCNTPHVICASATGPTAAEGVNGRWTDVDAPATYTNFGRSTISVAGPGGNNAPNRRVWLTCSRQGLVRMGNVRPCAEGQLVWQSTGTSFGAAATSGLAALLVSRMGQGRPDRIRAAIERSADDLGQPGRDPYYGRGRINVARALDGL